MVRIEQPGVPDVYFPSAEPYLFPHTKPTITELLRRGYLLTMWTDEDLKNVLGSHLISQGRNTLPHDKRSNLSVITATAETTKIAMLPGIFQKAEITGMQHVILVDNEIEKLAKSAQVLQEQQNSLPFHLVHINAQTSLQTTELFAFSPEIPLTTMPDIRGLLTFDQTSPEQTMILMDFNDTVVNSQEWKRDVRVPV